METNTPKVRFINKKDLQAEVQSQRAKLDFSQTRKGPGCDGCFSISFKTGCGHTYIFRKRCQVRNLVCAGSEILSVHLQDIVLRRKGCQTCRVLKAGKPKLKRKRGHRMLSPKQMAAKLRLEEGKEQWKRVCLDFDGRASSSGCAGSQKAGHVERIDLTGGSE